LYFDSVQSASVLVSRVHDRAELSLLKRALSIQRRDNFGCDALIDSCGENGACCDTHDICYGMNGCTQSSWWSPFASFTCNECNMNAIGCIAQSSPGPSSCCADGTCGIPRPLRAKVKR
ncbi:unnamed protein product, partial [Didymodactylos carnosus]